MEIKKHFGVYGTCFENGKLLCIEKTRGPYQHRYDLPGGSQQLGEGLTKTLIREVLEEITTENASPLVLKVKSELSGFPELDMTSYRNWKVK